MEGFHSVEEHVQAYIELFLLLQKEKEEDAEKAFREKEGYLREREQNADIFLPAVCLRENCSLTDAEYLLIMFALCCEVEGGLCPDCGSGVCRPPGLQYALHLLSLTVPVDFMLIAELSREKSMLNDILQLHSGEDTGLLFQPLLLNRMAFYFLLTGALPREDWYELFPAGEGKETEGPDCLPLHEEAYVRLCGYLEQEDELKILLYGIKGSGKHTLVRRACGGIQTNVIFIKAVQLWQMKDQTGKKLLRELSLICRLVEPVVVLELSGLTRDMTGLSEWNHILTESVPAGNFNGLKLIFLAESREEGELAGELADVRIDLAEALSARETELALDAWLAPEERGSWQDQLLGKYRFSIGELKRKRKAICIQAWMRQVSPAHPDAWAAGLGEQGSGSRLGRLVESRYAREDLILPGECKRQLDTVIRLAKGWDGEQGFHLLFHGSSGTGKTMAASVLAGQLQLALFKVDLSQIYDKYIGETEKHMDEIFETARRNRYVLFFDEADALFAKRTDIKDSHDRYANVSTAYLLQRIEEYRGILILATNLMDHFDDAFVRRIRFVIKFRGPEEEERRLLWERALSGTVPIAEDISYADLAKAARLSPARIKSAAQTARLLAAVDKGGVVTKEHIREALELEAGKDETVIRKL